MQSVVYFHQHCFAKDPPGIHPMQHYEYNIDDWNNACHCSQSIDNIKIVLIPERGDAVTNNCCEEERKQNQEEGINDSVVSDRCFVRLKIDR